MSISSIKCTNNQRRSVSSNYPFKLYSSRRYSLTSLYLRHSSISSKISSRSSNFMELSALNYSQHRPLSGCSQKLIGLQSIQTTLLRSRPSKFRSFTYSSISLSSSTMWLQCYCVRICLILRVGSIRLITSCTQLLTPAENTTGSHSSERYERKLSRFFLLYMLSRHSQSSNHKWKSSFLRGDIRYPSSSGVKVKAKTSSISSTTVSLEGSLGGGSNLGLVRLACSTFQTKYRLFFGFCASGAVYWGGFLLKLNRLLAK